MEAVINNKLRVDLFEILIESAAATEFSLGLAKDLNNAKRIVKIEAFKNSQVSISPSGKAVVADAVFAKSSLKLVTADDVTLRFMTLGSLSKQSNGTTIEDLNIPAVDLQKSKIKIGVIPNVASGVVAGDVFLLQITYEK